MSSKFAMNVTQSDMKADEVILCCGNEEKHLYARRTGSWIDGGDCKICSVCGDKSQIQLTHYCGNCGAKMLDIM